MKGLAVALQYLPLVLQSVVSIETIIGAGKGKTKKQLVMDSISAAAKAGEQAPDTNVAVVSALVDSVVWTLNESGVFEKSQLK